jgi:hypothetical protein
MHQTLHPRCTRHIVRAIAIARDKAYSSMPKAPYSVLTLTPLINSSVD